MWDERIGELIEPMTAAIAVADNDMATDVLLLALARTGELDEVARRAAHRGGAPGAQLEQRLARGAASRRPRRSRATYAWRSGWLTHLEPLAGRIAVSGISSVMGPVDGYLALALAVVRQAPRGGGAADRAAGSPRRGASRRTPRGWPDTASASASDRVVRAGRPSPVQARPKSDAGKVLGTTSPSPQEPIMSSSLYRLGRSCAAHPWRVLAAWALLVATVATLAFSFGAPLRDDWDVPGAASQHGLDLLRDHGVGGYASARVVVHDRDGDRAPVRGARRAHRAAGRPRARRRRRAGQAQRGR